VACVPDTDLLDMSYMINVSDTIEVVIEQDSAKT
jgi:hypothetical protein